MWGRNKGKIEPIVNVQGVFNAVQRVAGTYGKRLVQEEGLTQPQTSLVTGEVKVGKLNAYWSQGRLMKWLGEVHHELGHHAPELKDTLPLLKEKGFDFNSFVGKLFNLFDDVRNDKNHLGEFIGRDEALSFTQGFYAKQGISDFQSMLDRGQELDEESQVFLNALCWVYQERAAWQPDLAIPADEWISHPATEPEKYYHLKPDLDSLETAQDVFDLVMKIIEAEGQDPEEKLKEAQEAKEAQEGQEGEDKGEGEGKDTGEGQGEGKPEPDESEGGEKKSTVNYGDLLGHKHGTEQKDKSDMSDAFMKINYDHEPDQNYTPYDKMLVKKARDLRSSHGGYLRSMKEHWRAGSKLASAARRLFQARTQSMKTHNHRQGRLDKRDLYRIPSGSKDVFIQKQEATDPKGTAIFLLTDASGSMSGKKFSLTGASAALLNEAVQPLGIPMEIVAFTDAQRTGCQHYVIKTFGERRSSENILEDYSKIGHKLHQNADGESIMWAYEQLMKRNEPRKILIVISDGQPSADHWQDCYTYTKNVVKHVEKHVECYGVGLMDNAVKDFYKDYTVLNRAEDLEQCLLEVVKTKIFD